MFWLKVLKWERKNVAENMVIHLDYKRQNKFFRDWSIMLSLDSLFPKQRLYREKYEKEKDKIHSIYDTPEIKQVKATQEAISDVRFYYILLYTSKTLLCHILLLLFFKLYKSPNIFCVAFCRLATKRSTTAPVATWSPCQSLRNWCTATMSIKSPVMCVSLKVYHNEMQLNPCL